MFIACRYITYARSVGVQCNRVWWPGYKHAAPPEQRRNMSLLTERILVLVSRSYKHTAPPEQSRMTAEAAARLRDRMPIYPGKVFLSKPIRDWTGVGGRT